MSNLTFQNLLTDINCKTIIFFEDDFAFEVDRETIIYNYLCNLSETDKKIFYNYLEQQKQNDVCKYFRKLESKFKFKFNDYFEFAKKISETPALKQQIFEMPLSENAEEIFFVFGLLIPEKLSGDYEVIFKAVRTNCNNSIRLFKTYNDYDEYCDVVRDTLETTESDFVLSIIDENLTNSTHSGQEIEVILAETFGVHHLSFIFSSKLPADEDKGITGKINFDVEKLHNATINSFYKSLFTRFKFLNNECSEKAHNIAQKNYTNIKYIVKMAYKEGIHPFDAISDWFKNAREFYFVDNSNGYKINQFAEIINRYQLSIVPPINPEDKIIIDKINSHEVFDYSINQRHTPPSLGDIFFSEQSNKYYILLGQACDLALRLDNTRNAKIAELVEAKILDDNSLTKKLEYYNNDGSLIVNMRDFFDPVTNQSKTLEIKFSGSKIKNTSFIILDCCMFSSEGYAQLDLSENSSIKDLSENRIEYFNILKSKIKNIMQIDSNDILDEYLDISPFKQMKMPPKEMVDFGIKRIGRIQEQYSLFLNKLYYDHRGRIPINTIKNVENNYKNVQLNVELAEKCCSVAVKLYKDREFQYLNKSDLQELLPNEYIEVLKLIDDEYIKTTSNRAYVLTINESVQKLIFKIPVALDSESDYHYVSTTPTIREILRGENPKNNFIVNSVEFSPESRIDIRDLEKGLGNGSCNITYDGCYIKVDRYE